MELPRITLVFAPDSITTPGPLLNAMMLPSPAFVPPIVLPVAPLKILTPARLLPSAVTPSAATPMRVAADHVFPSCWHRQGRIPWESAPTCPEITLPTMSELTVARLISMPSSPLPSTNEAGAVRADVVVLDRDPVRSCRG